MALAICFCLFLLVYSCLFLLAGSEGRLPSSGLLTRRRGNDLDLLFFGFLDFPIAFLLTFGHFGLLGFADDTGKERRLGQSAMTSGWLGQDRCDRLDCSHRSGICSYAVLSVHDGHREHQQQKKQRDDHRWHDPVGQAKLRQSTLLPFWRERPLPSVTDSCRER